MAKRFAVIDDETNNIEVVFASAYTTSISFNTYDRYRNGRHTPVVYPTNPGEATININLTSIDEANAIQKVTIIPLSSENESIKSNNKAVASIAQTFDVKNREEFF